MYITISLASNVANELVAGVGVKTGRSRVGGPDLCVKADGSRNQGTQMFTQVRSMEVKPYFLLD